MPHKAVLTCPLTCRCSSTCFSLRLHDPCSHQLLDRNANGTLVFLVFDLLDVAAAMYTEGICLQKSRIRHQPDSIILLSVTNIFLSFDSCQKLKVQVALCGGCNCCEATPWHKAFRAPHVTWHCTFPAPTTDSQCWEFSTRKQCRDWEEGGGGARQSMEDGHTAIA